MCYNVESSLKTTAISLFAIVYLLLSDNPYYKWIAVTLIGWCLMQFAELLLWLTEPRRGCTEMNKLITLTLVPIALAIQPIAPLLGSLYVIPWKNSTVFRKNFIVLYSAFIVTLVSFHHFYKPYKLCTTVTPGGHLFWSTVNDTIPDTIASKMLYFIWLALILIPLFMFWDKNITIILLLIVIPLFGFFYGLLHTDSRGSIWCFYTSWTSVIASSFLALKQAGIYNIM